jgi:hypothetical protein
MAWEISLLVAKTEILGITHVICHIPIARPLIQFAKNMTDRLTTLKEREVTREEISS